MKIEAFDLERRQTLWENTVEYNLTESCIHPFTISELLDAAQIKQLQDLRLGYGQTNGSIDFRDSISKVISYDKEKEDTFRVELVNYTYYMN